jgi:signal transduction histidine kinase
MVRPAGAVYGDPVTSSSRAHLLAGVPPAIGTWVVLGATFVFWGAAVASLVDGPEGDWWLAVVYVLAALIGPVVLPWLVREFGAMQRARFRRTLGIDIPSPPPTRGVLRPWVTAALWRQLGYHTVALGFAALSPLALVPTLARRLAGADESAGQRLLGPGRAEVLTQRVEALARSRTDLMAAADAERRRIERDLHDGAQQRLVSLALQLGLAREKLTDLPDEARQVIADAHDEATQALTELRELVRGLHPAVLDNRGLDAALSGIVARAPIPVRLRVVVAPRCAPSIEAIAYFTVSEALTNVAKHARAGQATVTVERTGDRLRIVVTDDGRGGATTVDGSGLHGLAQRAAAVDGTLTIHSPPGGPTTLTVELPCD